MSPAQTPQDLVNLVKALQGLPRETEWVEFKENIAEPENLGCYISALANSAALAGKPSGYLVWGLRDADHAIVGTSFNPATKVGNEEMHNWLLRLLDPQVHFEFHTVATAGHSVVILAVEAARYRVVQFKGIEYIRVGSYKKKLKDYPDHERRLWRSFESSSFETGIARDGLDPGDAIGLLDYPAYFDLLDIPLPENRVGILESLEADGLIKSGLTGWSVTNLGAILFARDLAKFGPLGRKCARVIQYKGKSRVETIREQQEVRGYAAGFAGLIDYVANLLPAAETIGSALRRNTSLYPDLAIRELVANALIHQDFTQTGTGPMIELFDGRIEITSPGEPLVDPYRFVDAAPRSRNEALASLMRRIGVCEERGTGWDKIGFEIELHQLPAPLIEVAESHTRVVVFSPKPLREMGKDDRIRAVYLHACLKHVLREHTTNSSVRERFGIEAKNSATASRLIGEATESGLVAAYDPRAAPKLRRYVPFWAASDRETVT